MNPFISIIIPCHNEAATLWDNVRRVISHCEKFYGNYEIILVENGSTDNTLLVANKLQRTFRPVRAMTVMERSKAAAVRAGMLKATGEYRFMCDADLSMPISELSRFFSMTRDGWDVVIGSREHKDAQVETSFKRWALGRVFSAITQNVTGLDYKDTQCGFKLFTARAAHDIFERVTCKSMAFDVEALYLALQMGFYCTDIPITWKNSPTSRVRLFADSWLMLRDVLRIKSRHAGVQPAYKQRKVPA